jgi:glycosyltransferase involved in cell wall biosynthesis
MKNAPEIRLANFMDSCLEYLDKKGNLWTAPPLYNPKKFATKVVHFTPCEDDLIYSNIFAEWNIEIFSYLERGSRFNIINFVLSLYNVYKKLQKEGINIIRGRLPYLGSFLGCLAGKCLRIPIIVSLGGNNRIPQELENKYNYGSKWISYTMEKIVLYMCNMIIAPNYYTKNYVASIIGEKRTNAKVYVKPWIVTEIDHDRLKGRDYFEHMGLGKEGPYILVVGFLNKYKFSDIMFKVAEEVMTSLSREVQFVFCGDGPLRDYGQSSLQKFPNVLFLGWQPNEIVQSLINHASIILVPMSGFVLLEAASLGKPVIATNIEWHSELIKEGVTGFLVDPTSINEWAQKIKLLLDNSELGERVGHNLLKVFNSEYDKESLIDREIALYYSLINSRN